MQRGPRSLAGALPAYAWAAAGLVALLAVAAWGWWQLQPERPSVLLPAATVWRQATLDDGFRLVVLEPGQEAAFDPGRYELTLVDGEGRVERRELQLDQGQVRLDR